MGARDCLTCLCHQRRCGGLVWLLRFKHNYSFAHCGVQDSDRGAKLIVDPRISRAEAPQRTQRIRFMNKGFKRPDKAVAPMCQALATRWAKRIGANTDVLGQCGVEVLSNPKVLAKGPSERVLVCIQFAFQLGQLAN